MKALMLAAALLLSTAAAVDQSAFSNSKIVRRIDASSHVVSSSTSFKFSGNGAASKYYVAFPKAEADKIVYLDAKSDDGKEEYSIEKDTKEEKEGFVHYIVRLKKAIAADDSVTIKVTAQYEDVLTPSPAEITQLERQLVILNSISGHVATPYKTEKQSTQVKLPSTKLENNGKPLAAPEPFSVDGARVKLGPYNNLPAYSVADLSVHFQSDASFASLNSVVRELEVSLWGQLAVEEVYDLSNVGAKLKGGFGRIDYQMQRTDGGAFTGLKAYMPVGATDLYYRDVIGNISTSAVRNTRTATEMEVTFRFPLFGGWKTVWYQGYNVPSAPYLAAPSDGKAYALSYDAHVPFGNVPIKDYELRVILPEGATVHDVSAPFPATVSYSRRFTFFDSPFFGRPVVVFKATQTVISGTTFPGQVRVEFTLPAYATLLKPLYFVAGFLVLFVTYSMASRLNLSLKPKAPAADTKKTN